MPKSYSLNVPKVAEIGRCVDERPGLDGRGQIDVADKAAIDAVASRAGLQHASLPRRWPDAIQERSAGHYKCRHSAQGVAAGEAFKCRRRAGSLPLTLLGRVRVLQGRKVYSLSCNDLL